MPPKVSTLSVIRRIAAKETTLFFASPVAYLFLGSFVAVTLFIVFWGESFFARNIADVRPMFEWMPILLIVLCSTLTMRMWSEERRSGTLDHVLTQPVPLWSFVLGKFLGCMSLLAVALVITLPLPLTVSLIGDLDWGPVMAGYLATLLLGAAYMAIGLYVSARSSNQIVSLLSAVGVCGLFYLVGSPVITGLFSDNAAELLRAFGAGSRFESITRGMVDLSDLAYYLSLVVGFLALNTYALEKERWGTADPAPARHAQWQLIIFLILANAVASNLWLGQTRAFRVDVTEGNQYSISEATESYLNRLQEPLLIRGYFSSKTHPLLAPLVPKLKDLIEEYSVAGGSRVRVEFIDPTTNREAEEEAGQDYGIRPTPFQVADRYQSSIVSSYFAILVKYGSEYKVLSFQDLIEVRASSPNDVQVQLRNPEYDLTRTIKKVVDSYQSEGNVFSRVDGKLTLKAYISADSELPPKLAEFKTTVKSVMEKAVSDSKEKLSFEIIDPAAEAGKVAEQISKEYGLQAMTTDPFSTERFYFYLLLSQGDKHVQLPLEDLTQGTLERNLSAAVKRFAPGFSKTVALVAPSSDQPLNPFSPGPPPSDWSQLEEFLGTELTVEQEDLSDGQVSGKADLLLLASPKDLDEKAVFAVDQFLMQGGTVIALTSPYSAQIDQMGLTAQEVTSGLSDWLTSMGITIEKSLVMDPQSQALAIPITRSVGGLQIQDVQMLDYPYFIDVRQDGYSAESPITGDLPQVTVPWASPIKIDQEKIGERQVVELLRSSAKSWLSTSLNVMPMLDDRGRGGFFPTGPESSQLVGAVVTGRFESAFKGKPNPLQKEADKSQPSPSSIIEHSAPSAKVIVISSNDLVKDTTLRLLSGIGGGEYLNNLQLLANAIDWSMEDSSLLSIRARGNFNRTLPPMDKKSQMLWEGLNYLFAALALAAVAFFRRLHNRRRLAQYQDLVSH